MKRSFKRVLAVALSATMALSTSMISLAAGTVVTSSNAIITDSNATQTEGKYENTDAGKIEGIIKKEDVFQVDLPLSAGTVFDFIMDPQDLLYKTKDDHNLDDSNFTSPRKQFYFVNTGSNAVYSDESDKLQVRNFSLIDVDITVTATLKGEGIALSNTDVFTSSDATASMYLAVVDTASASDARAIAGAENNAANGEAVVTTKLDAIDDAYYVTKFDNGIYSYVPNTSSNAIIPSYEFWLKGATNTYGDWSELKDVKPELNIVWKVEPHSDSKAPSVPSSVTAVAGQALQITLDWGAGDEIATEITSLQFSTNGGITKQNAPSTVYDVEGNILTVNKEGVSGLSNGSILYIRFNDLASTVKEITVSKQ